MRARNAFASTPHRHVAEATSWATLAGDVQRVPHDSAWPLKNVSSVFWLFTEVNARFLRLERWVAAVNHWGQMGRWAFHVCRDPQSLGGELDALVWREEP